MRTCKVKWYELTEGNNVAYRRKGAFEMIIDNIRSMINSRKRRYYKITF